MEFIDIVLVGDREYKRISEVIGKYEFIIEMDREDDENYGWILMCDEQVLAEEFVDLIRDISINMYDVSDIVDSEEFDEVDVMGTTVDNERVEFFQYDNYIVRLLVDSE